ncbi:MAG: hypothetical protein JWO33_2725 [Caulobacteraceae bacterium]|jgi:hypothetical protein|nr:hypothetical protein [Caulobacteraceae bacterium]
MIRTLVFVGVIAALATPAMARDIRVSLVGKTPQQIHADIRKAARRVCEQELQFSAASFTAQPTCVAKVVARTEAQLPAGFALRSAAVATR